MMVTSYDENEMNSKEPIVLNGYAETLVCSKCGKSYLSRGYHDPGYCVDCQIDMEQNQTFIGGPLNGQKVR